MITKGFTAWKNPRDSPPDKRQVAD